MPKSNKARPVLGLLSQFLDQILKQPQLFDYAGRRGATDCIILLHIVAIVGHAGYVRPEGRTYLLQFTQRHLRYVDATLFCQGDDAADVMMRLPEGNALSHQIVSLRAEAKCLLID